MKRQTKRVVRSALELIYYVSVLAMVVYLGKRVYPRFRNANANNRVLQQMERAMYMQRCYREYIKEMLRQPAIATGTMVRAPLTKHRLFTTDDVVYGTASFYTTKESVNKHTATGAKFNEKLLTAASPYLPLPCIARVTNLSNGRSIIVVVNDRGMTQKKFETCPKLSQKDRIIDLSPAAAQELNGSYKYHGIFDVSVEVLRHESEAVMQYLLYIKEQPIIN